MAAKNDFESFFEKISTEEIKAQIDIVPTSFETTSEQKNDLPTGAGGFEFRPLTEEEKKEFINSLDAKGKQILAELKGEATSISKSEPLNTTAPTTAP